MKKIITLFVLAVFSVGVFAQATQSENSQKENVHWRNSYTPQDFMSSTGRLPYRILMPDNFDPSKKYPLILFLHGSGERGEDNKAQLTHGGELFLKEREKYPAIVVFPQAPKDDYWVSANINRSTLPFSFDYQYHGKATEVATPALRSVMQLTDWMTSKPYVDASRLYVLGLSMGGMGTMELLSRKPDTFAAAVVICGGANSDIAATYRKDLPIWFFHGEVDQVVIPKYSQRVVDALTERGLDIKQTLYPNVNHNSWDNALVEPELLPWLFSHKK